MRVLFDLLHPAHFHLFKHVITALRSRGDHVEIIARRKDCLPDLLRAAHCPAHILPRKRTSLVVLAAESLRAARLAVRLSRPQPFDFLLGASISIAPAARLAGGLSLVYKDDDAKVIPLFAHTAYPLAHYIVTPRCLAFEDHGPKHLTYPGYHELAYLHPNRFTPDPAIRADLGLAPDERFFLVRLVSLTAHHDVGETGLTTDRARRLVRHLQRHGRVFVSAESTVDPDLQPLCLPTPVDRIFDVLAAADLVVGDSQTMASEAAVLATPSLRCNTFKARLAYLDELEHRYRLTGAYLPTEFDQLLARIDDWLARPDLKQQWLQKRDAMLAETVDLTDWTLKLLDRLATHRQRTGRKFDRSDLAADPDLAGPTINDAKAKP